MSALPDPSRLPGVWRGGSLDASVPPGIPTGHARLDLELPGGGLPPAGLVDVLHDNVGLGEVSLLAGALAHLAREGRAIAWVNPPHLPYAPALAAMGVPLDACLVVRPASPEDTLWSADQALRSGACGAALLWLPPRVDYASLRRLHLAAEAGRTLAVLFRPASCLAQTSPAPLRLVVTRRGPHLALSIPKRRGPPLSSAFTLRHPGLPAALAA